MSQREIIIQWLDKATELMVGEEIFLPCDSGQVQRELTVALKRELRILGELKPVAASQIEIRRVFKDHKLWVRLRKVARNPLLGFVKGTDGKIKRVSLEDQTAKKRKWKLMRKDGYTTDDIIAEEDDLTEEDILFLKGGE